MIELNIIEQLIPLLITIAILGIVIVIATAISQFETRTPTLEQDEKFKKSFLGAGKKIILNSLLLQKQEEGEEEDNERRIKLKIHKTKNNQFLKPNQQECTILYECDDVNSSTLTPYYAFTNGAIAEGRFDGSSRRKGIYLDILLPDGTYRQPTIATWISPTTGVITKGIECPAFRHYGAVYTDVRNRNLEYRGNSMLVPYHNFRRLN